MEFKVCCIAVGKPIRFSLKRAHELKPHICAVAVPALVAHNSRETPKTKKTEETERSEMKRDALAFWSVATNKRGTESREYADCHRRTKCNPS